MMPATTVVAQALFGCRDNLLIASLYALLNWMRDLDGARCFYVSVGSSVFKAEGIRRRLLITLVAF